MPVEFFPVVFAVTVFALQGFVLVVDEVAFHRRREMPRWERIGHPLDTLTVLVTLLLAVFLPPNDPWTGTYLACAILSCLFVVKDEWVHARLCNGSEQALHGILFVMHPLVFYAAWQLWRAGETGWLAGESVVVGVFLVYQTIYWNFGNFGSRPVRS